ncbi:MAG: carbohydrate ABC transporter permease [Anaerolineales bacterium]|nr:carbohydrate ABC transporter permease [Anaerolineales bacterium]
MSTQTPGARQEIRWRKIFGSTTVHVILILFLLLALVPFITIVLTSFKDSQQIMKGAFRLPETWHFDNYIKAWAQGRFSYFFRSSVIVVIPVVTVSTFFAILTGYAFGRMQFRFKRVIFFLFLLGIMVPLILPQIGMSIAFGTFWMYGAFAEVPRDLEDAAIVDGCNSWQVLWRVLVPIVLPAILAMMVLFFVWTWNDFLMALVLVSSEELRTLPLGLAFFQGRYTTNVPLTAAGATIVALPVIVMYILFQRHFIRGVTSGAVQG